jgi:hypothetical protein
MYNLIYKAYNENYSKCGLKYPTYIKHIALMEYANESLKKTIRKIEDRYKDPSYKIKMIIADALKDKTQCNSGSSFILGASYCFLLLIYINNANRRKS